MFWKGGGARVDLGVFRCSLPGVGKEYIEEERFHFGCFPGVSCSFFFFLFSLFLLCSLSLPFSFLLFARGGRLRNPGFFSHGSRWSRLAVLRVFAPVSLAHRLLETGGESGGGGVRGYRNVTRLGSLISSCVVGKDQTAFQDGVTKTTSPHPNGGE